MYGARTLICRTLREQRVARSVGAFAVLTLLIFFYLEEHPACKKRA